MREPDDSKYAMHKIIDQAYQHAHVDAPLVADRLRRRGYDRTRAMIERLTHH
jgi:hypothetical protein